MTLFPTPQILPRCVLINFVQIQAGNIEKSFIVSGL